MTAPRQRPGLSCDAAYRRRPRSLPATAATGPRPPLGWNYEHGSLCSRRCSSRRRPRARRDARRGRRRWPPLGPPCGPRSVLPEPEELTEDHWFDLASVSKVIATTTMILRLADQGRLDLDAPLTTAIPDLRQYDVANAAERKLSFRDCLPIAASCPRSSRSTPMATTPPASAPSSSSASGATARRSIRTSTSSCSASRSSGSPASRSAPGISARA
jgi:hypothetical protein